MLRREVVGEGERERISRLARVLLSRPTPPTNNISSSPSSPGRTTLELQDLGVCSFTSGDHDDDDDDVDDDEGDCRQT